LSNQHPNYNENIRICPSQT